jgi:nicotinamidase-related amidase
MQYSFPMHGNATASIYQRAGFGARGTRGRRPAVVVVDLSRGFTEPHWPTGADLGAVVAATDSLLAAAHDAGSPVVFTTIEFDAADIEGAACAWLAKAPGLGILRAGSELVEIDPRLRRRPGDPVVVKKGASAFFGTTLAATLVALGVDSVLICGATTSGCVRASCVDAVQHGFSLLVPRECVGDRAQGPHEANLFDIDAKYGDVISLEDAVAHLRDTALVTEPSRP